MAHSLSAKKRFRQSVKRRARNRARKSAVKTQIKSFLETAKESSDIDAIEQQYKLTQKKIDKLAAQKTLHKNTAARKKSQLARQVNAACAKLSDS